MKGKNGLTETDIRIILRAADDIIGNGGRTLLAKILKGSKERKLLELGLDKNPCYGAFRELSQEQIMAKIDWMIQHDFLQIQYSGKLPMIIYTEKGWLIERVQYVDELLSQWDQWLEQGVVLQSMEYLKDRNRGMILLFLQKVKETGHRGYLPLLREWEKIEYKKVREAIQEVIKHLEERQGSGDLLAVASREEELKQALLARTLEPERLKCWECGKRFIFEVEEQKFFKMRGFDPPKRCPACREKKWLRTMGIFDV